MKNEMIAMALEPLHDLAARYPEAWKQVAMFRNDPDMKGIWPDWCFIPMAATYAIASGGGSLSLDKVADVSTMAAMAAWRVTQGIYVFEDALYHEIIGTQVSGDLPHEMLYQLPEWCVYIPTPGLNFGDADLYGFWAHLEYDINQKRPELRFILHTHMLIPVVLHLGPWSLSEAMDRAIITAKIQAMGKGLKLGFPGKVIFKRSLDPLVSLVLHLCMEG